MFIVLISKNLEGMLKLVYEYGEKRLKSGFSA